MTDEFEFSDEMGELRTVVRGFCDQRSPESAVRTAMESELGHDPNVWRSLGAELGILGLAVLEADGGDGAGLVYQAVVVEELGAALLPGPVLGTLCLAIPALAALSDGQVKKDYLPGLIGGDVIATLAAPTVRGEFAPDRLTVSAARDGDAWSLTGMADYVPDGATADLILLPAACADGVALFAVEGTAAGFERTALFTMDRTRRQAHLRFDGADARRIADPRETAAVCAQALRTATALVAVSQVGGAQRMLDVTVEHVRTRLQFGQPVGAFQAVKHRCANMLIEVEQARSAAYHAVWALQDGDDDPELAVALAKAVASDAYASVSRAAIQLHGGQGFTWEASPQLYLKRATADLLTLGTGTEQTENVARLVLDERIPAANMPGPRRAVSLIRRQR
jgi:alkylation response protein AidB-like acyl-CoA dehydrogenase